MLFYDWHWFLYQLLSEILRNMDIFLTQKFIYLRINLFERLLLIELRNILCQDLYQKIIDVRKHLSLSTDTHILSAQDCAIIRKDNKFVL